MADAKITALSANTTPAVDDVLPIVDDTGGTPSTQKITLANLFKVIASLAPETTIATDDVIALYDTSGLSTDSMTIANLFTVINAFTEDTTPQVGADFLLSYDASATAVKKVLFSSLLKLAYAPDGTMVNGKLSVTVSSNDLIVAIKTLAGNDPSSADPVLVRINGTIRTITAATSMTLADATNWFNSGSAELATKEIDYFAYAVWDSNSSVVAVSAARIPYGRLVSEFSSTTTNEKYLGNYANFTSTDDVVVIGRFAATLSAGAGYTWTVPTFTNLNLINHPIYNTRILSWQPAYSATGSMTYTTVTTTLAEYIVTNRGFNAELVSVGTTGGSGAPGIRASMPFSARNAASSVAGVGWTADGGVTIAAALFVDSASANLLVCRKYDGANYGLGTNRFIAFNGGFFI